jgi:methylenetetrahydrofolate dehydrogenase (NADP+)/methenyltetrahydrofolate cyclohydrolase
VGISHLTTMGRVKIDYIDVGINRAVNPDGTSRLTGDVDFDAVKKVAEFIAPVPGGIGPMTVAMLLENTVSSYIEYGSN